MGRMKQAGSKPGNIIQVFGNKGTVNIIGCYQSGIQVIENIKAEEQEREFFQIGKIEVVLVGKFGN
jgi:hypothetical protein